MGSAEVSHGPRNGKVELVVQRGKITGKMGIWANEQRDDHSQSPRRNSPHKGERAVAGMAGSDMEPVWQAQLVRDDDN